MPTLGVDASHLIDSTLPPEIPEPEIDVALTVPEDRPELAGLGFDLDGVSSYRLSQDSAELNLSEKGYIVNGTNSKN